MRAGADFNERLHEEGFAERFLSGRPVDAGARAHRARLGGTGAAARRRAADRLGSTTHISVLDGDGNAASVTCSNGTGLGRARRRARAST